MSKETGERGDEPELTLEVAQERRPKRQFIGWHEPEKVRAILVFVTLGIFSATVLLGFFSAWWFSAIAWTNVDDLLRTVIPIESLIIGGAVSFYYAGK